MSRSTASRAGAGAGAKHRLMHELTQLQKEKWVNIDLVNDNILRWRVGLIVVNSDSAFNGGYYKVSLKTPSPHHDIMVTFLLTKE